MSNPQIQEFAARVSTAIAGSAYLLTPTDDGFRLTTALGDPQWSQMFQANGTDRHVTHDVTIKNGSYSITDELRQVQWTNGVPTISASVQKGRVITRGPVQQLFVGSGSPPGRTFTYDTNEGRRIITGIGNELGLKKSFGRAEKTGLFAVFAVVGLIAVVPVVFFLMTLMGLF